MIVSKKVSFDAAHFLPNYVGPCHNVHGHHWIVELGVEGRVMEEHGFVVDFSRIKDFLQEHVIEPFDHKLLNDIIPNPTAENIALHIKECFDQEGWKISGDIKFAYVRVWETENSMVELI